MSSNNNISLFGTNINLATCLAGGFLCGILSRGYKVAAPHQYILKTGLGITQRVNLDGSISGFSVSKTTFVLPFQRHMFISMNPMNYRYTVKGFNLPLVINYRPFDPIKNPREFQNYAARLSNLTPADINVNIISVIDGEIENLVIDKMSDKSQTDTDKFKMKVTEKVQKKLAEYGLEVI